jgi:3-phosphoglycerate kinase
MSKLSIRDIELRNKHVFIRVDFNVPLSEDGSEITDDTRIVATLPTIEYALRHKAKVILASHLGRPKGKPNPKYSLRPVVDRLRELLDKKEDDYSINVAFAPDCVGEIAANWLASLNPARCCCLKTCASTLKKRPTIQPSQKLWPRWQRSTLTTLSAPRIGRMRLPKASRISSSPPLPAC